MPMPMRFAIGDAHRHLFMPAPDSKRSGADTNPPHAGWRWARGRSGGLAGEHETKMPGRGQERCGVFVRAHHSRSGISEPGGSRLGPFPKVQWALKELLGRP